ncbi:hypothetical protein OY671_012913, partial [Metschnikowia pulcherrima]
IPADHGVRRSLETGSLSAQPHGHREARQQCKPHPARRRRPDRRSRLQRLHQQPARPDLRDQRPAHQGSRPGPRPHRRCRRRQGCQSDPDQCGPHRRAALGLPAGAQAGRRHEHNRGCRRRPRAGGRAPERPRGTGQQGRLRPVGL